MSTEWGKYKLGFGLMRLPKTDDQINIPAVCDLVDAFIEKGFTYFDTAYVYGGSEAAFKEAVVKRYPRDKYTIATKMAGWQLGPDKTPAQMFQEQLDRTGVEYFDYYLLHSIQPTRVEDYEKNGCWDFVKKMKEAGKIRYYGFSFHGDPELLEQLLSDHPDVDFVQIQLNYVDWDSDSIWSGKNYEVCEKHRVDVVVMEPVKGGFLAKLHPDFMPKLAALDPDASPSSFALRFAASLPNVKMVLSGMNAPEQMEDNLRTFANFKPLSEIEKTTLFGIRDALLSLPTIPCTSCRYCTKGCPMNIDIPEIFKAYNMYLTFGEHNRPHLNYSALLKQGSGKASDCIQCGQCEAACPQHIGIIEKLEEIAAYFDK